MNRAHSAGPGPAGLVIVSSVFILMLLVGGVTIGVTRNRTLKVGERIAEIERKNHELEDTCRRYEEKKASAIDILNLRREMGGVLDAPTKEQIVTLPRRTSYTASDRKVSDDPRFTALDIAFIRSTPDRKSALR